MKKIVLFGAIIILLALTAAIVAALRFGETAVLYAEGKISLSEELQADATGVRTVFVTVFDADSGMPMPYGAMRQSISEDAKGNFLEFFLTPQSLQVMNPSAPLPKNIRIKARLDRDGQGGMDQAGDLVGEVATVALGSKDVHITIDKRIE